MHNTSLLFWPNSADKMREALCMPDELPLRCRGSTSRSTCCRKQISKANVTGIQQLLNEVVAAGSWAAAQELLEQLSQLVLCQALHQHQGPELLFSWETAFAEAEKRHCVGKRVARRTTTSISKITITHESIYIDTHTTPAKAAKRTTKSEPEEDSDLAARFGTLGVQDDTDPADNFVPYSKPCTPKQINRAIRNIIKEPLSPNEKKDLSATGSAYIFKSTDADAHQNPYLKIGFSCNLEKRMKQWEYRCGYKPKLMSHSETSLTRRAESLVHKQLQECRKRQKQCPGCGASHIEFFDVRLSEANRVIGLWVEWIEHQPYDEDGMLKPEWRKKLLDVDLSHPDCWEEFAVMK